MALHDPVEDALNARKKKARLVEAGAAIGSPNEESLNITRSFLEGGPGLRSAPLPVTASSVARSRAFGQQGVRQRSGGGGIIAPTGGDRVGSLSDSLIDLPTPVGFAQTPQGRAILQRILGRFGGQQRRG